MKLHYGYYSDISGSNRIYNNSTAGIELIDTWGNVVEDNIIASNPLGIILTRDKYPLGEATRENKIYHNNIIRNSTPPNPQVSDDAPCPTGVYEHYWYEPSLLEGNYWSDYTGEDTNSDGIGDTSHPYECYDDYPYICILMGGRVQVIFLNIL